MLELSLTPLTPLWLASKDDIGDPYHTPHHTTPPRTKAAEAEVMEQTAIHSSWAWGQHRPTNDWESSAVLGVTS